VNSLYAVNASYKVDPDSSFYMFTGAGMALITGIVLFFVFKELWKDHRHNRIIPWLVLSMFFAIALFPIGVGISKL